MPTFQFVYLQELIIAAGKIPQPNVKISSTFQEPDRTALALFLAAVDSFNGKSRP
jgi:hypothetical protein